MNNSFDQIVQRNKITERKEEKKKLRRREKKTFWQQIKARRDQHQKDRERLGITQWPDEIDLEKD